MGELKIDENTGGIYCYTSLDSKNWSRWPEHGSLNSSASLQEIPPLVKPHLLSNLKDKGFETETKTLELNMECWGWQGPNLIAIGNIKDKIDIAAPQEIHLVLSGATFDILPKISLDIKSKLFELGSSLQTPSIKVVDQYSVETLGYVPESDQMPYIVAWESDDPGICEDHMLDPAGKELFCSPLPGFTAGPGGSYPQKYLVWYVLNGGCPAYPEKECFSLDWWENFAKYNPDPYDPGVHFMVRNRLDANSNYDMPVDTDQWAWRIHPDVPPTGDDKCLFNYRWLKVYLDVKSSVGEITSSPSNEVTVICPQPLGDTVDVEVNFYSLTMDNIDDGDDRIRGSTAMRQWNIWGCPFW